MVLSRLWVFGQPVLQRMLPLEIHDFMIERLNEKKKTSLAGSCLSEKWKAIVVRYHGYYTTTAAHRFYFMRFLCACSCECAHLAPAYDSGPRSHADVV